MRAWAAISTAIGWTYFLAWSVSFYPQLILNWRRKAVTGLSLDYVVLNILGFACYSIYTVAFLSSSALNKEYKQRHPDSSGSAVRANDAVFAIHAFILSCAILCQACFLGYERAPGQMISLVTKGFLCGSAALMAMLISLVWLKSVEWIDVVYVLSYIKLSISFIKMPAQLLLNYKRQSTIGWSIVVPLLDLLGGVLSLLQLVIDCALTNDWSGLTGNAVKTGLGSFSIIFDTLFILQHYALYSQATDTHGTDENDSEEDERSLSRADTRIGQ